MAKLKDLDTTYIQMATRFAALSHARRLKVGALIVTRTGIIVPGFNGTPPGFDNNCEIEQPDGSLVTKPEVIHAEMNAILKAAAQGVSIKESTVYCTHAPCKLCAGKMVALNLSRFVFKEHYGTNEGLELLESAGVTTELFKKGHKRHRYETSYDGEYNKYYD